MSDPRAELAERRDHRLRDLLEIERQLTAGELTQPQAAELRRRYERQALAAVEQLDALEAAESRDVPDGRRWVPRLVTPLVSLAVVAAVGGVLATSVIDRPEGGFITGNELGGATAPTAADIADASLEEVEAAVDANPDAIEMRFALAELLVDEGRLRDAIGHYLEILDREEHPRTMIRLGWLVAGDEPRVAHRLLEEALELAPDDQEALWLLADLELRELDQPTRALERLERLRAAPLTGDEQRVVDQAIDEARDRAEERS